MAANNAENEPLEVGLYADFVANLSLLQELQGILNFAILKDGVDEIKALVSAELVIIGIKLRDVPTFLNQLEQLDEDVLETYGEHLSSTLVMLNEMVGENLATEYSRPASSKSLWSGLVLLHDIIASRYKTVSSITQGEMPTHSQAYFSDMKLSSYLAFDMGIVEQDLLLENLYQLNRDIDELLAIVRSDTLQELDRTTVVEEEDNDIVLVKQAQDYRQQISSLYRTLAKNMGACEKGHMAQLCLSNFGIDKNNLNIYISVCHGLVDSVDSQGIAWHPTKCSKKDHAITTSITGSLCEYLNEARARQLPAVFVYSDGILSEDPVEIDRLPQDNPQWSFIDLAAVLDDTSHDAILNLQIRAADKLRLQCLITQSLLFLHPSSWMPETLNLSNFHFTTQTTTCDLKNPYIYCAFRDVEEDQTKLDITAVVEFMIHFGLLLLQIEMRRPLSRSPQEMANKHGYELALDRYMKEFSGDLNAHITQVLRDCLWFENCLRRIPHTNMPLDLKIRFAVSQRILKPLVGSLEFNYPNIAREILPYTMEQRQRPKTENIRKTRSAHKRKVEEDSAQLSMLRNRKIGVITSDHTGRIASGRKTTDVLMRLDPLATKKAVSPHTMQVFSEIEMTKPKELEVSRNNTCPSGSMGLSKNLSRTDSIHVPPVPLFSPEPQMLPEDFTVGWISVIPLEQAVALEMLDEIYPPRRWPYIDASRDHNSYTFGRLHGHNVVTACLPKGRYGTTSAANVAQHMQASFPAIRFGLLVGIAGGAPSQKRDIRLGDVVVGTPTPGHPGVIQYDFGKALAPHGFEITGHMTPPPSVLLNSVTNLEAQHKCRGHKLTETVVNMIANNRRLKKEYSRPAEHTDRLYKASYKHCEGVLCACQMPDGIKPVMPDVSNSSNASATEAVVTFAEGSQDFIMETRTCRDSDDGETLIHYGLIASANSLMKDADTRDILIQKYDVLCFEMEAAGVVNSFPCIVIRGICDYSDSHKNDIWQGFAAANAAAYAKELLEIIPCHDIKGLRSIS